MHVQISDRHYVCLILANIADTAPILLDTKSKISFLHQGRVLARDQMTLFGMEAKTCFLIPLQKQIKLLFKILTM